MASSAILLLENEQPFFGRSMGSEGMAGGVMATCALAAGFPDLLTDPSYDGKMVCFTYPHVGNAGVVPDDLQSDRVAARAVVAREISRIKANRLGTETLPDFLQNRHIPAIEGVDTRTITEIVARRGKVRAVLGCGKYADVALLTKELEKIGDSVPAAEYGTARLCDWSEGSADAPRGKVLVYDFGVKRGFLRRLNSMGCALRLAPPDFPAEEALREKPDGVVFSSGPGTPETRAAAKQAAAGLLGKLPLWGVGVGAGIVAAAAGAGIKVDGRSHIGVQPVGRSGGPGGEMTAQCHDFWIDAATIGGAGLMQTHYHLNDGSLEGFKCDARKIMGVLFHPEAEPGPRDSLYLFDRFLTMMRAGCR